jgi:hypothetical protein
MGLLQSSTFGELATKIEGEWIEISLDANMNEVSTLSATVTSNPVEDGADIADNAIDDPDEIQIDGLFTNTPANLPDLLDVNITPTRAEDAYADLIELKEKKETVTITTTHRILEDMFITRLTRTRNSAVGEGVSFTMSARKIRKVQSSVAEVPLREEGGKGKKKSGGVEPNTSADDAQNATMARNLARPFIG